MTETFELPVALRIRAPLEKVFAAWIDSAIAEQWFCDRLEGEWKPGASLYWHHGKIRQEVRVTKVEENALLAFRWRAGGVESETEVEIRFEAADGETRLRLRERQWELSRENVMLALDHACGWENTFCRLKAWVESGAKLKH